MRNTNLYIYLIIIVVVTCLHTQVARADNGKIVGGRVATTAVKAHHTDKQMNISMTLCLDSLKLGNNQRIVLTPYILGESGDSIVLRPVVINSRRQQVMYERRDHKTYDALNAIVVRRAAGCQNVDYNASVAYEAWMKTARVRMAEDVCGCGDIENQNHLTLKTLRTPKCAFSVPVAADQKTYQMHGRAFIDFPVDRTELHPDYRQNPRELAKIIDTINIIKRDTLMTITHIDIHGYASPESPYEHNDYLATNRALTLKNYVRQLVRLDDGLFSVSSTPEDWDGLCRQLKESNLDGRDEILAIASDNTIEPDRREWLIKSSYPEQYKFMLATWYPALRHSDYTITCSVRPFSVEEAKRLIDTRPHLLSENEMFRVAVTYEPGSEEFNHVMEVAVRMFPNDATANLNAACTRLSAGQYDAAKAYLDKAGTSADADNARGVYYWLAGDEEEATHYFKLAAEAGCQKALENLKDNM